jgi:hypothetical protein
MSWAVDVPVGRWLAPLRAGVLAARCSCYPPPATSHWLAWS